MFSLAALRAERTMNCTFCPALFNVVTQKYTNTVTEWNVLDLKLDGPHIFCVQTLTLTELWSVNIGDEDPQCFVLVSWVTRGRGSENRSFHVSLPPVFRLHGGFAAFNYNSTYNPNPNLLYP
ncbi:Hypothetical predicted protein [Scomber scombrus]|uniref:Uncharacterized protein n=1 Tax=Scomber scombrus TaxID=13677 RepID=A0AAV1QHI0_SCOSC